MRKFLIFSVVGVVVITMLILFVGYIRLKNEKSFSPEEEVVYTDGDLELKVQYNRPFKRNRVIFGELVPYGAVWRTGANEATIFQTNRTITIEGKKLNPGKYSFWTIPDSTTWAVIFNTEAGQWGINHRGEANRNPALDAVQIPVHAVKHRRVFEQFTIAFEKVGDEAEMVLLWDNTVVAIPFSY